MASQSDRPFSRFRLSEDGAQLIEALLRSQRRLSVRERRRAISAEDPLRRGAAEEQLKLIDRILEEIEDVQYTNAWHSADGRLYT